jgi:hypothetical protein
MLAAAAFNTYRLATRWNSAVAACYEEGRTSEWGKKAAELGGHLVCNATELDRLEGPEPTGAPGDVLRAYRAHEAWRGWGDLIFGLGLAIIAISSVPWLWYFLLRRLRELGEAVRGR